MLVKIGKGIELDVDTTRFTADVHDFALMMGLRNILMDSHANETEVLTKMVDGETVKTANPNWKENSRAIAERKLASLYAGETRSHAERETDVVKQMALDTAERAARAEWRKTAGKDDKFDNPRKRAAEWLKTHPEIHAQAQTLAETAGLV